MSAETPGLVPAFRYVRAHVVRVDPASKTEQGGPYFEARSLDAPEPITFLAPVSDCEVPPCVGQIVTFRVGGGWDKLELVTRRDPIEHDLKCAPLEFDAVMRGDKRHETRVDDRDYRVGDVLHLRMWTPERGYSGQDTRVRVTYKTNGGTWGLPVGLCVLSIARAVERDA